MNYKTSTRAVALALTLFLCAFPGRSRADIVYNLNVDTSSIEGTQGYLDLQFNPTGGTSILTATVPSLTGNATVGSFTTSGNVTRTSVPLVFAADNSVIGQVNDAYASTTFGSSLGLTVDITTPDNSSTASFQVTLYDQWFNPLFPLLGQDPNNPYNQSVIELDLVANPNGAVPTVSALATQYYATAIPAQSVPEPGAFVLAAEAVACLVMLVMRRRKWLAKAA
jgi:hypothetical protein